jgi:hypothetical protein
MGLIMPINNTPYLISQREIRYGVPSIIPANYSRK